MARIVFAFLVMWLASFAGYSWLKQSTWREKATLTRGIFVGLLTAAVAFGTLGLFVALF